MKPYNEPVHLPSLPVRYWIRYSRDLRDEVFAHPHWHDEVEVLCMAKGRARHQLGDRIFVAGPGDLVIIWSNQIHSIYRLKDEECEIRVYQWAHHEIYENELIRRIGFTGPVEPAHPLWPSLQGLLERISAELDAKADGYEYQVKACVYQFFATVIRRMDALPAAFGNAGGHRQTLQAIFDYVDGHYTEPVTLRSAADAVYLSVPHFTRVFKSATGMTFKSYLNRYRVDRAAALLRQGCTTAQAAERCGFGSVNTFIRLFKAHKKCTPSLFR